MWFMGAMTIAVTAVLYFASKEVLSESAESKVEFYVMVGVGILTFAVMIWATAFVSSLTISIEDEFIKLRFGGGSWRKKFALENIVSAGVVRTTFWHGWGIHHTGTAWLYNVAGFEAVEITLKNGKKKWLGTDQPQKLTDAINSALGGLA